MTDLHISAPERIQHTLHLRADTAQNQNVVETFADERNLTLKSVALQSGDTCR